MTTKTTLFNHPQMTLTLNSQRLVLAPMSLADLDITLEMFTDPVVVKYAGGVVSESTIKKNMANYIKRGSNGCIGIWTVADRQHGEKYGTVALLPIPIEQDDTDYSLVVPGEMPNSDIEIGYFLKPSAWGRGYATEASQRLLQFAFEESPLKEVVATFDKENMGSRNVLQKSGFTNCGTMRCYGEEGLNFRITREDWIEQQVS